MNEHRPLNPGEMYISRIGKKNRIIKAWRQMRHNKLPICCAIRLCLDMAQLDGKITTFEEAPEGKRGAVRSHNPAFVPCGIFHHGT